MALEEKIYDVIKWGVVYIGEDVYFLLSPRPFSSDMDEDKVKRSMWQLESTLKWEAARTDDYVFVDGLQVYTRSIIIFGSNALIEFFQDPKTIKVKYVTPSDDDN